MTRRGERAGSWCRSTWAARSRSRAGGRRGVPGFGDACGETFEDVRGPVVQQSRAKVAQRGQQGSAQRVLLVLRTLGQLVEQLRDQRPVPGAGRALEQQRTARSTTPGIAAEGRLPERTGRLLVRQMGGQPKREFGVVQPATRRVPDGGVPLQRPPRLGRRAFGGKEGQDGVRPHRCGPRAGPDGLEDRRSAGWGQRAEQRAQPVVQAVGQRHDLRVGARAQPPEQRGRWRGSCQPPETGAEQHPGGAVGVRLEECAGDRRGQPGPAPADLLPFQDRQDATETGAGGGGDRVAVPPRPVAILGQLPLDVVQDGVRVTPAQRPPGRDRVGQVRQPTGDDGGRACGQQHGALTVTPAGADLREETVREDRAPCVRQRAVQRQPEVGRRVVEDGGHGIVGHREGPHRAQGRPAQCRIRSPEDRLDVRQVAGRHRQVQSGPPLVAAAAAEVGQELPEPRGLAVQARVAGLFPHAARVRKRFEEVKELDSARGRCSDRLGGPQRPGRRPPFPSIMRSMMADRLAVRNRGEHGRARPEEGEEGAGDPTPSSPPGG
ncbi:hypothetical protein AB0L00_42510 [Actinoallomurus sp. NPDC052308]|uniref:hypothetical protein n=1 Tax=Actinoallomurus sp. NPDC052308 TaxID=3155530 RepID=UPI003424DD09